MKKEWVQDTARGDRSIAIVVTYHPDAAVLENLEALRPEIEYLIVVDNGSSPEELSPLRSAADLQNFDLIENSENLGIATALNIGIRHALSLDGQWVFLFDQDSRVTTGFARSMVQAFTSSPWNSRLAILVPQYKDMRLGISMPATRVQEGIETAITSGSLLCVETFRQYGLFCDELFIDAVDHEYSLRLRKAGLVLEETPAAMLLHSPGALTYHDHLWSKPFLASNYPAIRRYYQERNKIWMALRYGRHFPGFFLKQFIVSLKDLAKIVLVEKGSWPKVRFFLRGIADGLRGRMGKLDESSFKK